MALYASGEDYLEAVLVLQRKIGTVRSVDLARHMNFSKPSISNAVSGMLCKATSTLPPTSKKPWATA